MKHSSTIPVLIITLILIGTMLVPGFSATTDTLRVTDSYGLPGQAGTFAVVLSNTTEIKGLYFTLSDFPDSLFVTGISTTTALNCVTTPTKSANFRVDTTQVEGTLKVLMLPIDPDGTLLEAKTNATGDTILFVTVDVADGASGGTTADMTLNNVKLAGTTNAPVTNIRDNGRFWFGKKLDVIYNGVVDLFDVLRIVDIALDRGDPPTSYELWAADWDDDGLITVVDIGEAMDQAVAPSSARVTPLSKTSGSVKISLPALPANFVGKIDVPVTVNSSAALHGLQFELEMESDNYVVGSPSTTSASSGMSIVSRKAGKKLNVIMCGLEGQSLSMGESTVMTIPVTIRKALNETSAISINHAIAGSENGSALQTMTGQSSDVTIVPQTFALHQNSPNPFNMNTTITFDVPSIENGSVPVKMEIFNTRGQLVKTLVDHSKSAGRYTVHWNGSDDYGREVSSGVYFYRFSARDVVLTKKLAIMK